MSMRDTWKKINYCRNRGNLFLVPEEYLRKESQTISDQMSDNGKHRIGPLKCTACEVETPDIKQLRKTEIPKSQGTRQSHDKGQKGQHQDTQLQCLFGRM